MFVSIEVIAVIVSSVGVVASTVVALFVGLTWVLRRMDERIDGLRTELGERIDGLDSRLSARIDGVEQSLGARLSAVERELVEVKVAVARLEGPRPHLLSAR
ncbi:MAG: hypothetical protein QM602_06705 [Microbacterium sp.]